MPQLPRDVVKDRASRLREAAARRRSRWLDSLKGSSQRVLIEGDGKGHTDSFAPVALGGATRGQVVDVIIEGRAGDYLVGVAA
jgi:threonylcarbamoyladenosine tRNA methylthiotransferase MtaB